MWLYKNSMHILSVLDRRDLSKIIRTHEFDWDQLCLFFKSPVAQCKDEIPLVVGAKFAVGGPRNKDSLEFRTIIPIDLDGGVTLEEALARCRKLGLSALVHTTANHLTVCEKNPTGGPRLRVFIPLTKGVSASFWDANIKGWIAHNWPESDAQARDAVRVSYAPVPSALYTCEVVVGTQLEPPSEFKGRAPHVQQEAPVFINKARAESLHALFSPCVPPIGHRNDFYLGLSGFCAKQNLPIAEAKSLVISLCTETGATDRIAPRLKLVKDTYEKYDEGRQVGGLELLERTMRFAVGDGANAIVQQASKIIFGMPEKEEKETPSKPERKKRNSLHVYTKKVIKLNGADKTVRTTINTLAMLLDTDEEWSGVWQHDIFADRIYAVNPPMRLDVESGNLTRQDIDSIRCWFAARGYRASAEDSESAIMLAEIGRAHV